MRRIDARIHDEFLGKTMYGRAGPGLHQVHRPFLLAFPPSPLPGVAHSSKGPPDASEETTIFNDADMWLERLGGVQTAPLL